MTDDERQLLLHIARYIASMEDGASELLKVASPTETSLRALIKRVEAQAK